MGTWFEDFSNDAPEEIVGFEAENTRLGSSIRVRVKTIIQSKLAGDINQQEYLASRKLTSSEATECSRRRMVFTMEFGTRGH
jgi:hypothetical protein